MISALLLVGCMGFDAALAELENARNAYLALSTAKLKVSFDTKDTHGRELKGTADILFQAPNKLRAIIALEKSKTTTVVCDGKQFTVLLPKGGWLKNYSPDELAKVLPLNVETLSLFNAKTELSASAGGGMEGSRLSLIKNEDWNGKKWDVLEERSKPDDVFDRYFIDPQTHLIWRVIDASLTSGKVYTETKVQSMTLGEPISAEKFQLSKN